MKRLLTAVCLVSGVAVLAVCLYWIRVHPLASSWDESGYLNRVIEDRFALQEEGVRGLARQFLYGEGERPPAYRVMATPLVAAAPAPPALFTLRLLSVGAFLIAIAFVYAAARQVVSRDSSLLAAAFVGFSRVMVVGATSFGMGYVLEVSVAALYWLLFRALAARKMDLLAWIGIAVIGVLGGLSKSSFPVLAAPPLAVLIFLMIRGHIHPGRIGWGCAAWATGAAVLAPWWVLHWRKASEYAAYASGYSRHDFPWVSEFVMTLLGPALAAFAILVVLWALVARVRTSKPLLESQTHRFALWLAAAGAIPLMALHIAGQNHNMFHLMPVLFPLALAFAVLLEGAALASRRITQAAAAIAVLVQAGFVIQLFVQWQPDQWSWEPLRQISLESKLPNPRIAHMGNGTTFTPPAITLPWVSRNAEVKEKWLWRYEAGPIDWAAVDAGLDAADIVVTAPGYVGDEVKDQQALDNQHNDALVERLSRSNAFASPRVIRMGERQTPVFVYVRRQPDEAAVAAQSRTAAGE